MDTNKTFTLVPPARLEGYGVRLREWADADLADLVALYDDPEMARWTPVASPFDLDAARAYLAGAREGQAEGRRVQLAVTTDGILYVGVGRSRLQLRSKDLRRGCLLGLQLVVR